jgi:hypothetical protein
MLLDVSTKPSKAPRPSESSADISPGLACDREERTDTLGEGKSFLREDRKIRRTSRILIGPIAT